MRLARTLHKFANTYELWVFTPTTVDFINYIVINGIITSVKTTSPDIKKEFPLFVNIVEGTSFEELNHLLETHLANNRYFMRTQFTIIATSNQILLNTEALQTIAYLTLTASNKVLRVFVVEDFLNKFPKEFDLWVSFVHQVKASPKDIPITIDNYNKQLTEGL